MYPPPHAHAGQVKFIDAEGAKRHYSESARMRMEEQLRLAVVHRKTFMGLLNDFRGSSAEDYSDLVVPDITPDTANVKSLLAPPKYVSILVKCSSHVSVRYWMQVP